MLQQSTRKRDAEMACHRREASLTMKASSQPAVNRPPRLASVPGLPFPKRPSPQSLASISSIEDSPPLAAKCTVEKSSASATSIKKSSSAPSTTRVPSTSVLQKTPPDHSGAQNIKQESFENLWAMSREELLAYGKSQGWDDC
jgi:hypothetical protein